LVSGCIALVLNENVSESSHSVPRFDTPAFPKEFSRAVIKLVGRYLLAIRVNQLFSTKLYLSFFINRINQI
jgi:hypothetical protein